MTWSIFLDDAYMLWARKSIFNFIQFSLCLSPLLCPLSSFLLFSSIPRSFYQIESSTSWRRDVKIYVVRSNEFYPQVRWMVTQMGSFALKVSAERTPAWSMTQFVLTCCKSYTPKRGSILSFWHCASCQRRTSLVTTVQRRTICTCNPFQWWLSGKSDPRNSG